MENPSYIYPFCEFCLQNGPLKPPRVNWIQPGGVLLVSPVTPNSGAMPTSRRRKKKQKTRTTSFHRAVSFHSRPLSGNLKACPAPTTKRHLSRKDLSTPKTNMLKYKHKKGNRREPASRNRKQPQSTLSSRLVQPGGGSGSARSGTL